MRLRCILVSTIWKQRLTFGVIGAAVIIAGACISRIAGADVFDPGDVIVVNNFGDSVYVVDASTGDRLALVGNGPAYDSPTGIAFDLQRNLLVSSNDTQAIYRVDRVTGDRSVFTVGATGATTLSISPVGTGPDFLTPREIVTLSDGTVVFADSFSNGLIKVEPGTGNRSYLSIAPADAANAGVAVQGTGPAYGDPEFLLLDENAGKLFVSDTSTDGIFEVDIVSGDRRYFSIDPTNAGSAGVLPVGSGPDFGSPTGLVLDINGDVLVSDLQQAIFRVDRATGDRSILSQFPTTGGGDRTFRNPLGMVLTNDGRLLSNQAFDKAILEVDLASGDRTVFSAGPQGGSNVGAPGGVGSGPEFSRPWGMAVVPVPEPSGYILALLALSNLFFLRSRQPRTLYV